MSTSAKFWEERYASGGTSGDGSRGDRARFKADYLNAFVFERDITDVIEFGCGEGAQLQFAEYPHYLGLDVSPTAIALCRERFALRRSWAFNTLPSSGRHIGYDLALSLDVIYHLIEDEVFERHMHEVFMASKRYVILYTTNMPDERSDVHVRHRPVTSYVEEHFEEWELFHQIPNPCPPDSNFFSYRRIT